MMLFIVYIDFEKENNKKDGKDQPIKLVQPTFKSMQQMMKSKCDPYCMFHPLWLDKQFA